MTHIFREMQFIYYNDDVILLLLVHHCIGMVQTDVKVKFKKGQNRNNYKNTLLNNIYLVTNIMYYLLFTNIVVFSKVFGEESLYFPTILLRLFRLNGFQ